MHCERNVGSLKNDSRSIFISRTLTTPPQCTDAVETRSWFRDGVRKQIDCNLSLQLHWAARVRENNYTNGAGVDVRDLTASRSELEIFQWYSSTMRQVASANVDFFVEETTTVIVAFRVPTAPFAAEHFIGFHHTPLEARSLARASWVAANREYLHDTL